MSFPFVQNVKAHFPNSRLTLLVKEKLFDLWKDEFADSVLTVRMFNDLSKILKKEKFNCSFILAAGKEIAKAHAKAEVPLRIGYDFWNRKSFLTHFIPTNGFPNDPSLVQNHAVQNYLNLLRLVSVKPSFMPPKLILSEDRKINAAQFLRTSGLSCREEIVGIAAGDRFGSSKRWPSSSYLKLIEKIAKTLHMKVILLGSEENKRSLAPLSKTFNTQDGADFIGKTTLDLLIGLVAHCKFVVSNDSGISHLSNALGIPTVTIFGSSSPQWTGPLDSRSEVVSKKLSCSPCFFPVCPLGHTRCLKDISVESVFRSATRVLAKINSSMSTTEQTIDKERNQLPWAMATI